MIQSEVKPAGKEDQVLHREGGGLSMLSNLPSDATQTACCLDSLYGDLKETSSSNPSWKLTYIQRDAFA